MSEQIEEMIIIFYHWVLSDIVFTSDVTFIFLYIAVRVMIEFDIPGHAASWCTGYPEICPSDTCLQPLDPSSDLTFELIESLLGECTTGGSSKKGLFPYSLLHLGGDEVDYKCWNESPEVKAWAKKQGELGAIVKSNVRVIQLLIVC